MMKKLNRRYFLTAVGMSAILLLLSACVHKDLVDDEFGPVVPPPTPPPAGASEVEVIFDWAKAPEADVKSMALFMYPEQRDVVQHWFNNSTGGIIKAHSCPHTAVCINNDNTFDVLVKDHEQHETLRIMTTESTVLTAQSISTRSIPRPVGTEYEPLCETPPLCYGTHRRDIVVESTDEKQTVVMYPEELICRYYVDIVDVKNLKNADLRIDGTISSLANGYYPGN